MQFPKQIQKLSEALQRLPGVGQKTAERLVFYLLHVPDTEIDALGNAVLNLKKDIFLCSVCRNISDHEVCEICADPNRDQTTICVVEQPLDVFSLEGTGKYRGLYHVLHGVIDPLHNIGPEELYINDLLQREASEIILALNPTMEGEATAMYIKSKFKSLMFKGKISRLGMGMPTGGDIQYADETTLTRALEGRRNYDLSHWDYD